MQNKTITITGIESNERKIIILAGKDKHYFWITKRDGSHTTAYEQFQKFRFSAGDTVEIAVKEEERTFVNDKGKTIVYTDRCIMYFPSQDIHTPRTPNIDLQAPPKQEVGNYVSREEFEAYKSKIEARIKYLEDFGNADVQEELKLEDIKF